MKRQPVKPDSPGWWRFLPTGDVLEVYPLEPVGGTLCVWGPDVGINYTGAADTQGIWDTDEWQGHIPVSRFGLETDEWEKVETAP